MYLVYDVGGTFIKYGLIDADCKITEKGKVPTPAFQEKTVDDFLNAVGKIYDTYKASWDLEGIAMSLPGQIDIERGFVYGGGALPYLDEKNVAELVSRRCGGLKVALENDAKCAALAESWLGNAKGLKTACVIVIGTGIGSGLIIDGRVHHGQDMIAGELSFWIDNIEIDELSKIRPIESLKKREDFLELPKGLWNNRASIMNLRRDVAEHKGLDYEEVSGEQIYEWAAQGDKFVIDTLNTMYLNLAKQLCNLYIVFAPEIFLLGGGVSAQPMFIEGVKYYVEQLKVISKVFRNMKVDRCRFMNDSNMIGALKNYMQKYEK